MTSMVGESKQIEEETKKREAATSEAALPGIQAESQLKQQEAAQTPAQRALQGNLSYQAASGNRQAARAMTLEGRQKINVAAAEATARVTAAQKAYGNAGAALASVPPHLVPAATADATKIGQAYADAVSAGDDIKTFIDQARAGNKMAYAYAPTEGVLTINTARGVKRVNMAEISSYAGAGSAGDRITAFLDKQTTGASIPANILNDMQSLHGALTANAQKQYTNKLKIINQNYGSNFQPVQIGPGTGGTATAADPLGIR
jgi:hypothetical protein